MNEAEDYKTEIIDIYDKHRQKTGKTIQRINISEQQKGEYRLVVHVCIFNSAGEMLIQQRQPFKRIFPDKWDITAGGAVMSGETSERAGERELFEETGLKVSLKEIHPSASLNFYDGFNDFYLVEKDDIDIENLHLQYEEVKAVKWATKQQIFDMIDTGEFIPYNKGIIEMLFFKRNHKQNFEDI